MRKLYLLIIAFLTALGLLINPSCTKDYLEPVEIDIPDTLSFSEYILPIFEKSCNNSGCHVPGGQAPDLTPSSAYNDLWIYGYVDTADAESSLLYSRMNSTSDPMPPSGKLTDDKIQLVQAWIEQGAQDN